MTDKSRMFAALLLLSATSAIAQVAIPTQPRTVSQVVDFWVTNAEQLIVPAADAMPEAKYSFAPSNGEFSGVRTFAEQVKHLAAANYQLAAATLGEEPPAGTDDETAPDSVKSKAQVMDYLKGSFASLHRAAAALKESNMDDPILSKGNRTRLLMLIDALVHSSNHYGQMVEYLRMNNMVPPASR
ncbi:MAG: DinB family protein [Candidatus Sulfotelmatobacter sp.]